MPELGAAGRGARFQDATGTEGTRARAFVTARVVAAGWHTFARPVAVGRAVSRIASPPPAYPPLATGMALLGDDTGNHTRALSIFVCSFDFYHFRLELKNSFVFLIIIYLATTESVMNSFEISLFFLKKIHCFSSQPSLIPIR
jgi:hypothetical protein